MQVTLHALEVVNPTEQQLSNGARRSTVGSLAFRRFGEVRDMSGVNCVPTLITWYLSLSIPQPAWIPKDSHDITALAKNVGICTERGIHVVDPTK